MKFFENYDLAIPLDKWSLSDSVSNDELGLQKASSSQLTFKESRQFSGRFHFCSVPLAKKRKNIIPKTLMEAAMKNTICH